MGTDNQKQIIIQTSSLFGWGMQLCNFLLADFPSKCLAQADNERSSQSVSLLWLLVSPCSEMFWVAEPLLGCLPQIIQAWVIESWLQIERQDRQGQILFCVRESKGEEKQIHFRPAKSGEITQIQIETSQGRTVGFWVCSPNSRGHLSMESQPLPTFDGGRRGPPPARTLSGMCSLSLGHTR